MTMADARITIDGAIASDPRFNTTPNGAKVANIRVLAGRSKKNDDGSWEQLSTTAYDVSFWNAHAELADMLTPEKGSKVTVTGTVTGVESYQGERGESLSVKVNGDGLRVYPKKQQSQQGGFQQNQHQGQSWGQEHQGQGGQQDPWAGSSAQSTDGPPF